MTSLLSRTLFFLLLFIPVISYSAATCRAFPFFKPTTGPLAVVNCDFHTHYEKRVNDIMKTFGAPGGIPIILNLAGTLVLKYNGEVKTVDITPSVFHQLKVFSHSAFTVYLILSQTTPGLIDEKIAAQLSSLNRELKQANASIKQSGLSAEDRELVEKLTNTTDAFLKKLLSDKHWTKENVSHFYAAIRPLTARIANSAASIELTHLDHAINEWMSHMTTAEKAKIGVVVATAHQARQREISLEYFAKKFGFKYGIGAQYENKFVVLEGKFDEPSALALFARHYLDRDAADVIFNDPERLQRDALEK